MAALALVYANASGVVEVADQARAQQAAESALGAGATARNAIGQALLLAQGDFDSSVSAAAIDEARVILQELESRIRALAESTPSEALVAAAQNASVQASAVLSLIENGDVDAAGLAASGPATQAFEDLSRELTSIRGEAAGAIAQAAAKAGSVATASRFAVAFFVPTIAVGLSLVLVRRRRKREQLAADLERERTINRSKDQLIANLSHELRTPLTGIYTSALTIEDTGFEDLEVARELNSMIVDQSADLNRMVEDLLVSAQADAGRLSFDLRPTDPVAEIESVVKELSRLGTPIRVQAETSLVVADGGRLRQLLRNLISNAVRHGGSTVEVFGAPTRSGYVIRVEDDGPGVPEEIERRLFERFVHQGDRPLIVGSVGLGLAITRVLAEHMGGRIEYRRDSGRTIFEVHLRRAIDDGAAMPPAPWAAPDALIDDDQSAVPDEVSRIHR
jgi:two-component system OmpR family sensor kinase